MILDPAQFGNVAAYRLLEAASKGLVGIDHRWLHALVDEPARTTADLLRFAAEDHAGDPVCLDEDLVAIFRHLKTPEALPFFVELVERDPYDIPDEVVEAFTLFPEHSVELLLPLYEKLGPKAGTEAAFLLACLRVRDQRVRKLLEERLDEDPAEGAFFLGLCGDPAARPVLERLLEGAKEKAEGGDEHSRWVCQSVREAIEDLGSPEPQAAHPAFDIWDGYPATAEPRFSILTEPQRLSLLAAPSSEYRAGAAASFFHDELSDAARERLLEAARRDASAEVRARAWEALGNALDSAGIREALLAVLNDESAPIEERCGVLVGLASAADESPVRGRILEFYELPAARAKALESMYRSMDRRFAPFFSPHLDDTDPEIRRQAIWGIGHLGIQTECGRLRSLFEIEDFREDALFAYTLAVPAQISRGRARALFRKVDADAGGLSASEAELVRWAVDERLARLGLDPVFSAEEEEEPEVEEAEAALPAAPARAGRNDPCPCGSGRKYKKCCGA